MYGGQGESSTCHQRLLSPPTTQTSHAGRLHGPAQHTEGSTATPRAPPIEAGLEQPRLQATGEAITGKNKTKMCAENRKRRRALQQEQGQTKFWTKHTGTGVLPATAADKSRPVHRNFMCLAGLALTHPAAKTLLDWATFGCPTKTGKPWSRSEIDEAIARGPHRSALTPDAIAHFAEEVREKVRTNQARIIEWDTIKDNPPTELKISPIAAIPHKSKAYRSILDLSFKLRLTTGGVREAVNDTTEKTAPGGAIDQIGECLSRIIHAFAEADEDAKIFMAK